MSSSSEVSWITWFCGLGGNEFLLEVPEEYIHDSFNLTGLKELIPNFNQALDMILDLEPEDDNSDSTESHITHHADELYALIHARYILTEKGLAHMLKKYEAAEFGHCLRVYCEKQAMLPIGLFDVIGESTVKLYCPKCKDVYHPSSNRFRHTDGAYFGTGFPHMFFMAYPELRPKEPKHQFVPTLYGFKIHPVAVGLQRIFAKDFFEDDDVFE